MEKELLNSTSILGTKRVYFLRHGDGTLSNNLYHKIAGDVLNILDRLRPAKILTFEMRGLSGHIDHIAMSMISTEHRALIGDYFVRSPLDVKKMRLMRLLMSRMYGSSVWRQFYVMLPKRKIFW